ncbi:hypothetical protein BMS3Abin14_00378 [bacterium BMS3Abin14]|nr:hypothetical protein BMS3Abin14_00378 [bacterium BMS3Abin14]
MEISNPRILTIGFFSGDCLPFSSRKAVEIVSAPKAYGFDTGFTCFFKGWRDLRPEDRGRLWEHYVLNEIQGNMQTRKINYWRTSSLPAI